MVHSGIVDVGINWGVEFLVSTFLLFNPNRDFPTGKRCPLVGHICMVSRCVALQWLCGFRTLPRLRLGGSVGMKVKKNMTSMESFKDLFVFHWVKTCWNHGKNRGKHTKTMGKRSSWKFQPAIVQLERRTQECEQLIELGFRSCKCPGERWFFRNKR